jgi:serine/threonine-protein kinase HipA
MNRQAKVYMRDLFCGWVRETDEGYAFTYEADYLAHADAQALSLTLPLTNKPYTSSTFFPFFDGLIPEGWLLNVAEETWKLNHHDRFGLLLTCCRDCIGAVRIETENEKL